MCLFHRLNCRQSMECNFAENVYFIKCKNMRATSFGQNALKPNHLSFASIPINPVDYKILFCPSSSFFEVSSHFAWFLCVLGETVLIFESRFPLSEMLYLTKLCDCAAATSRHCTGPVHSPFWNNAHHFWRRSAFSHRQQPGLKVDRLVLSPVNRGAQLSAPELFQNFSTSKVNKVWNKWLRKCV